MPDWRPAEVRGESFQGLLLRHRGRTGLTQAQLAAHLGVNRRTVQDWETRVNYPSVERLQSVIGVLLNQGGLSPGHELEEAAALWTAVERESARMRTPFDKVWFARLLSERAAGAATPELVHASAGDRPMEAGHRSTERRQDWGEAPDVAGFVGRDEELALLRGWVLDPRCRLVAVLGMGGIGKTSLIAKLAQELSLSFERVYWRSVRDAPPISDWLAGAIGYLSDQQVVPPAAASERLAVLLQLLRNRRCLLLLDNFETLLDPIQGEEGIARAWRGTGVWFKRSLKACTTAASY